MILELVRLEQCRDRLGQAGEMLGDIDQRDSEIARGTEDGKPQRAHQHHVARGRGAPLPERDDPGQQRNRQHDGHGRVRQPEFLEIAQAPSPRAQFPADRAIEPVVFMTEAAEGAHQRHVVDDIDHLAVHRGGLAGEIVMQGFARRREAEHGKDHDGGDRRSAPPTSRGLTVPISRIAEIVAMHGGITFHIIMFSTVKTAFEVAVMRLVSMPGSRSVK